MTNESGKSKGSWWTTLPGILTALGTIIGATATLLVSLHTIGWFGPKSPPPGPKTSQWPLPITADNVATRVGENKWSWTVFIQGPEDALDQIRCVEYTLHPTFPNPVRTVCQKGTGSRAFALSTTGWGTFEIGIRVITFDGRVQKLSHRLRF